MYPCKTKKRGEEVKIVFEGKDFATEDVASDI